MVSVVVIVVTAAAAGVGVFVGGGARRASGRSLSISVSRRSWFPRSPTDIHIPGAERKSLIFVVGFKRLHEVRATL